MFSLPKSILTSGYQLLNGSANLRTFISSAEPKFPSGFVPYGSQRKSRKSRKSRKELEPPIGQCCGSGCPNCVWVQYAEKLVEQYRKDGIKEAMKKISEEVEDPTLRSFIKIELQSKFNK